MAGNIAPTPSPAATHEHYWVYDGMEVDPIEYLWPIQRWYKCLVCNAMKGIKP